MRRLAVLLTIAAVAACGPAGADRTSSADSLGAMLHPLATGDPVPAYAAAVVGGAAGDSVRLGGYPSGVTLVNVWATWCATCREELALLDSLHHENAGHGLRVVAVSVDEGSTERVARFIAAQHLGFTVAHDPESRIQRDYSVVGVPETFLIGADGRLIWSYVGELPDSTRAVIARALASGR